jgi:DNA-binding LacI/PurR family transcriptional regulator
MQLCHEMGRRVPEDLALVGFDDIDLASLVKPALTTVHVPRYETGEKAMDLLFRVMSSKQPHEESIEVDINLITRDSCGANTAKAFGENA